MNQEKIGKFIAECRRNKKMTQAELAEKLGVTNRSVSNWENGKNMPDLSLFQILCLELEITINELISGEKIVNSNEYQQKSEENIFNTLKYTNKKIKFLTRISFVLLIVCFLLFIGTISYGYFHKQFNQNYVNNEASRTWTILKLSFHKNLVIQLEAINEIQRNNHRDLETKESLLYDFAQFHFIPILDYLEAEENNKNLIQGFSNIMDFMANYNCLTNRSRESIFIKQKNNSYYSYNHGAYIFNIEKKVIDKSFFQQSYYEYLNLQNKNTVKDHFLSLLFQQKKIKEKYSFFEIEKEILENYDDFYIVNREIITSIIGEDLLNYSKYLKNYLEEAVSAPVLKKKITSVPLTLTYQLTEAENIFSLAIHNSNPSYYVDLDNIWKELKENGFPKIYM